MFASSFSEMTYLQASWNSGSGWVRMLVSARSTVAIRSLIKFPVYIEVLRLLNSYPAELLVWRGRPRPRPDSSVVVLGVTQRPLWLRF